MHGIYPAAPLWSAGVPPSGLGSGFRWEGEHGETRCRIPTHQGPGCRPEDHSAACRTLDVPALSPGRIRARVRSGSNAALGWRAAKVCFRIGSSPKQPGRYRPEPAAVISAGPPSRARPAKRYAPRSIAASKLATSASTSSKRRTEQVAHPEIRTRPDSESRTPGLNLHGPRNSLTLVVLKGRATGPMVPGADIWSRAALFRLPHELGGAGE